ncbi:MAG: sugar phosphate isomerase/epimerase [Candidatus Brockarchaeota archaeon]|nr:sugar phosphate isomerase/epimerase [Candidatus Brockarchaeota archaeon]
MDEALGQPWESLFEVAARVGFDGVELGVGENYGETKLWKSEGRRELRRSSESCGVAIASICLHSYWRFSFASNEEAVRRRASEIAEQAAFVASEVGARNLLVPVTSAEGVSCEEARSRWVREIRSCAPAAEKFGVIYALENVGQPFAETGKQLASMIDEVGSPAVKAYYDPGNAVYRGLDPVADIKALGWRISQVHVKDPGGELLGEGKMDIKSVVEALEEVGFGGWFILETPATDDPIGAGKKNLEFLRRLLGEGRRH